MPALRPKKTFKRVLWSLLMIAAVAMLRRYYRGAISYGELLHLSGNISVALLALALAVTPLRKRFASHRWPRTLLSLRRTLGVASFGFAALHTAVYLERKWGYGYILYEGVRPDLLTGWIALAIFAALAVTSNDASVKRLKRRWQQLHRWVYPAAALVFAHWMLTAVDPRKAVICLAILIVVVSIRWWPRQKR